MAAAAHEQKVEEECIQIQKDIMRLGTKNADGKYSVKFSVLFDDEFGQQFYEALLGTMKAAKKKGFIDFKGQMLLRGNKDHDNTDIILINPNPPPPST